MSIKKSSLKISRILHAGYIFECDGVQIAFDPIFENPFSNNCHAFPNVEFDREQIAKVPLAAVFISHYHDDHCSLESLNLLDRNTPLYIYCLFDELFSWVRALGFKNVHPLKIDTAVQVAPFHVIPRRALDADVDSLFQIEAAGLKVLNVVDSWIDDETLATLKKNKPWDVILWPFQTMREIEVLSPSRAIPAPQELPLEWIEQLHVLNPRAIVPSSCQFVMESWSWYNRAFFPITYRQFQQDIENLIPGAQVLRLDPSQSLAVTADSIHRADPLSFVTPVGDQNVDYKYQPNGVAPTTAEIAKHFPALTHAQTENVLQYCKTAMLQRYKELPHDEDNYFSTKKLWRLCLYDHLGSKTEIQFHVQGHTMEVIESSLEPLGWFTEISLFKLYNALEFGETLTSLYIRINDVTFTDHIEKQLESTDLLCDPLIRSLFDGVFGAYQKNQLKQITGSSQTGRR